MPSTVKPSVAIILTGGTIGSVLTDTATRADQAGNALLQSRMETLTKNRIFDFHFHQLLAKDSGDFDMPDWHAVASEVDVQIKQGCKRFLITHGTDTLPFTATLLQLLFGKRDVSIALAAAFFPLSDPRTDATANITAAMALLTQPEPRRGVFIPFRGTGRDVTLHHATNVQQMSADAGSFHSFYDAAVGVYKEGVGIEWAIDKPQEIETDFQIPTQESMVHAAKRVYFLAAYPGMNLAPYHALAAKDNILLVIRNYHSGTANASDVHGGVSEFIKRFPESLVVFAPLPAALIKKPYESTLELMRIGAFVYRDLPPHKLYVLGVLGMANGLAPRDALLPAQPWLMNKG